MLENIINKTRIGIVAAAISIFGCRTIQTSYPLADRIKQEELYPCGGDGNPNLYCDDTYVYPLVVFKVK